MRTYTARVNREGKWWMIRVPDIDGLTQARRLGEAEEMARSLIAITTEADPHSFDVRVELEAIEDVRVTEWLDRLHDEQDAADEAQTRYRTDQRQFARELAGRGVPVRDIGTIMGLSFQRAQQLMDA